MCYENRTNPLAGDSPTAMQLFYSGFLSTAQLIHSAGTCRGPLAAQMRSRLRQVLELSIVQVAGDDHERDVELTGELPGQP